MAADPVPRGDAMSERLSGNIARLVQRREQEDAAASLGARVAEWITGTAGSMWFVLLHVAGYGAVTLAALGLLPGLPEWPGGLSWLGSVASIEGTFLALFVLMNQRRQSRHADRRADLDLHISLLTEDELTKLAQVIERIAEKLDVHVEDAAMDEIKKNVDPEQVLDALDAEEDHDPDAASAGRAGEALEDRVRPAAPAAGS